MLCVKNYMELYFDGVGRILLADEDGRLTELSFLKERALPAGLNLEETPLLREARRQLEEYEEKLHFSRLLTETSLAQSLMMTEIATWAQANLSAEQSAHVQALIDRDYSQEASALFEKNRGKLS